MNCQEFANVLDENPIMELTRERQAALYAHAHGCRHCASAWLAVRALRADPIPAPLTQPALRAPRREQRRMRRLAAVLGVLGFGGAVFAGVAYFQLSANAPPVASADMNATVGSSGPATPAPPGRLAREPAADSLVGYVAAAERAASDALATELLSARVLPDGEFFALLKIPPRYPQAAASAGLEGDVVVEFTLTPQGDADDAVVLEASDPLFAQAALDSVAQYKYKPRVVAGQAVAVTGVRTVIRFLLARPQTSAPDEGADETPEPEAAANTLEPAPLDLSPAYACIRRNDLRCVELHLDEILATSQPDAAQAVQLWQVYGFIHHRRGDYERAIDAYLKAAGPIEDGAGYRHTARLVTVAQIHYERHQYQEALDFAVQALRANPRPTNADYVFIDRLRQLGAILR